jgi:2-amino-4-hydroxy-6-hydroxymethyldihydropteridine diphosphokinase
MHLATVGAGSNLGDREALIRDAIRWIGARQGNVIRACSPLYETEPFGRTDQGWFLNCVVQVETSRGLKDFFHLLQEAEALAGRVRKDRWGPRTLDLDLLFFGSEVFSDAELTVPHPGVAVRRFVLEPLCEVAPEFVHPLIGATVRELLDRLADPSRVVRFGRPPV